MATKLVMLGDVPGVPPPVGTVYVYPKADEQVYFQGSDGVEHQFIGQVQPFAICDGAGVAFVANNGGFSAIARHAGEPAGVWDVTLTAPVVISGTGFTDLHGAWPFIPRVAGAANPVSYDASPIGLAGVPGTMTGVKVTLKDAGGVKVDGFFDLFFNQI